MEEKIDREKILRIALDKEKEARDFYLNTVDVVKRLGTKVLLQDLAKMEDRHVVLISKALETGFVDAIGAPLDLQDIRLSDYLTPEKKLTEQSTSQDVLIYAIHKEVLSEKFYIDFAGKFQGTDVETLFHRLAGEEANHKKLLEKEYEDFYMKEM